MNLRRRPPRPRLHLRLHPRLRLPLHPRLRLRLRRSRSLDGMTSRERLLTVLRGGIRFANSERCNQTPRPVDCAVTGVAGLERK